jgi:5-methylcytosine-specific restriction protein A
VKSSRRRTDNRGYDAKRRKEQPGRKFYDLAVWRGAGGLRAQQLARHPLCERHLAKGEVVAADTVNHRVPHKGDWKLFCDPDNHESTCKDCHDAVIQAEEARGYAVGCNADGRPIARDHPWNAQK